MSGFVRPLVLLRAPVVKVASFVKIDYAALISPDEMPNFASCRWIQIPFLEEVGVNFHRFATCA